MDQPSKKDCWREAQARTRESYVRGMTNETVVVYGSVLLSAQICHMSWLHSGVFIVRNMHSKYFFFIIASRVVQNGWNDDSSCVKTHFYSGIVGALLEVKAHTIGNI